MWKFGSSFYPELLLKCEQKFAANKAETVKLPIMRVNSSYYLNNSYY